jgi:hypothetical protein
MRISIKINQNEELALVLDSEIRSTKKDNWRENGVFSEKAYLRVEAYKQFHSSKTLEVASIILQNLVYVAISMFLATVFI